MTEKQGSANSGETSSKTYKWILRPNYIDGNKLLSAFPEIVEGKFVIRTWQKGEFLVPQSREPGVTWDRWFENGVLGQVTLEDVAMSFEDEMFVYSDTASPDSFYDMKATGTLDENLIRTLGDLTPETYIYTGCSFRFATKDLDLHKRLYSCELIQEALDPMLEQKRWLKLWLDAQESALEQCRHDGCQARRIKLSVFCAKHHLNMLGETSSDF